MEIDKFLDLLVRSRLSSLHEAQELIAGFRAECDKRHTSFSLDAFCEHLIKAGLLTAWQRDKLYAGKFKGFYMDNYLLLEQIGKDDQYAYFRARDARNGKLVRLIITPMEHAKGPEIEYRVDRTGTE